MHRALACLLLCACSTVDGPAAAPGATAAPMPSQSAPGELAAAMPSQPSPTTGAGAIVVELFTSQGCSSCPPADRLLRELAAGRGDRPLIALAYHVDYWNDLGWADPFSTAGFTARQQAYAATLPGRRVYTPALVVNGAADVVGSQRRAVTSAIAEAALVPGLAASAAITGATLQVEATLPPGATGLVAVYEDGLVTQVRAGENRGETLTNDRVVRALVPIAATAAVALDPAWDRAHLGAVVLAAGPAGRLVAAQPVAMR